MGRRKQFTAEQLKKRAAERMRKWRLDNPQRAKEIDARYHTKKPHAHRDTYLRRTYGLTHEAFAILLAGQGGVCAICRTDKPNSHGWCVDHDHSTGAVRGILCHSCNTGIGALKDSLVLVQAALEYLNAS